MKRIILFLILLCSLASISIAQTYVPLYGIAAVSGTNTYTASITPTPSFQNGLKIAVKFTNGNSGASTFNLNSLGAVALTTSDGTALTGGEIANGSVFWLIYDLGANKWKLTGGSGGNIDWTNIDNTPTTLSGYGITGTKAQFNAAVSDGDILYVGDVTQYTDEMAQDAIGAMIDGTLNYIDGTPLLQRAALTGDITASQGSNVTTLSNTGVSASTYKSVTVDVKGRITSGTNPTTLSEFGITDALQNYETINIQTGNYTLQASDFDSRTLVVMNCSGPCNLTVAPNITTTGKTVQIIRVSTDPKIVTFVEGAAQDVIPSLGALTDAGQNVEMSLKFYGSDIWRLQNGNPLDITASDIEDAQGYVSADAARQWSAPIIKGSNQTLAGTSTAWENVTGMSFSATSGLYEVHAFIKVTPATITEGIGLSMTGPTLVSLYQMHQAMTASTTFTTRIGADYDDNDLLQGAGLTGDGGFSRYFALVRVSASGTIQLRARTEGNSINVTLFTDSFMWYRKLN